MPIINFEFKRRQFPWQALIAHVEAKCAPVSGIELLRH